MSTTAAQKNVKSVAHYAIGEGALALVPSLVAARRAGRPAAPAIFLVDEFFSAARMRPLVDRLGAAGGDVLRFVSTVDEPTTDGIDAIVADLRASGHDQAVAVVGMGGGITLDTAKAVANLLTNGGQAADYQGWDLVRQPGVYKIGVPTLSGTGAESSRTCVMTNHKSGLKLGMNSDHTVYDQLVLDPSLSATVPRNQYFFTGMDTYIHCIESLSGSYRNAIGDAYAEQALALCREVFLQGDMQSPENRERLMVASYLGGCAIGMSFVGVVHPMSAGLSVVLGTHHCVGNCIAMLVLDEYYPEACREFRAMAAAQGVDIPTGVCASATAAQFEAMAAAASLHERPLSNALGPGFREILTRQKMMELFRRM